MMEAFFGTPSPMWTTPLSSGFMMQSPLQQPIGFTTGTIGAPNLGAVPVLGNVSPITAATRGPTAPFNAVGAPSLVPSAIAAGPPMNPLYPILANPLALTSPDFATGVPAAALLAAVALRRGQPHGPTNDQEVEDFIYEALELLPGTSDVEVRSDNGRATLAGTVHHKRIKHDVGEIAWAIPGVLDVQNNVTIASRRRTRSAAAREMEVPPAQNRK